MGSDQMRNLFFVTGLRKSGTSMMKTLFDGHPEVYMFPANEFELFHYTSHDAFFADKYCRENNLGKIRDLLAHNSFIERLNRPEYKGDLRKSVDVAGFQARVKARPINSYPELIEAFMEEMAASSAYFSGDIGSINHALKCVMNEEYLPELLSWFPRAKMIYVLRNPYGHLNAMSKSMRRGVKGEGQRLTSLRNPFPLLGQEIRTMRMSYLFMEKWRALYPDNFYVVVYDKLLMSPAEELRKLCDFLQISFNESLLTPTVGGEVWGGNSWKVESFSNISTKPATHWKEDISALEVHLVNKYFGEVLNKYGFEVQKPAASIWAPVGIAERPLTYMLNRLTWRASGWFGRGIEEPV